MNTKNSSIYGKAYEYACILSFDKVVSPFRDIEIEANKSVEIARKKFECLDAEMKKEMLLSAQTGIETIIQMEPRITEDGNDTLTITLQPDSVATKKGDIRDVLIIRRSIKWEIGISVKHNHSALKHSRLSPHIDFGKEWMGIPCSLHYFQNINKIFSILEKEKEKKTKWANLNNKADNIYIPILKYFMNEFISLQKKHNATSRLVSYLIGSNGRDYYKLIHHSNHKTTIAPFNLNGTLNLPANAKKPKIKIPTIDLPDRIIELSFKENSKTTIILTMNKGWSISMRIHSASSIVEPSLKFDIQLQSKPEDMFYIDVKW